MIKENLTKISAAVVMAFSAMSHTANAEGSSTAPVAITSASGVLSRSYLEENIAQIQGVTREGRELYNKLSSMAENKYVAAEMAAIGLRDNVIGALAMAEFLKSCLPANELIRTMDKNSLEYKLCRAVAEMRNSAQSLDNLIRQILQVSPETKSNLNPEALISLASNGTKAANNWL